jgi:hypothetical protein
VYTISPLRHGDGRMILYSGREGMSRARYKNRMTNKSLWVDKSPIVLYTDPGNVSRFLRMGMLFIPQEDWDICRQFRQCHFEIKPALSIRSSGGFAF